MTAGLEPDDVWQENVKTIIDTIWASDGVVAAWGVHGARDGREDRVMIAIGEAIPGVRLTCLGTTKDGHPRHPLYLRSDAARVPYRHGGKAL